MKLNIKNGLRMVVLKLLRPTKNRKKPPKKQLREVANHQKNRQNQNQQQQVLVQVQEAGSRVKNLLKTIPPVMMMLVGILTTGKSNL